MATSTTRLGLRKPAYTDLINEATDLNTPFDTVDDAVGATVATSGTRPSSPYSGRRVVETDSGNHLVRDGVAADWLHQSNAVINNEATSTDPFNAPYTNLIVTDSPNEYLRRYTGSAWKPMISLGQSPTNVRAEARYRATAIQAVANSSNVVATYETTVYSSPHVTRDATNKIFTLNLDGLWSISVGVRFTNTGGTTSVAQGDRSLVLRKNSAYIANRADTYVSTKATLCVSTRVRCVAGDTIDSIIFQTTGSSLNTDPSLQHNFISFAWLRS